MKIIAACLLILSVSAAQAQTTSKPAPAPTLEKCAEIGASPDRLACGPDTTQYAVELSHGSLAVDVATGIPA